MTAAIPGTMKRRTLKAPAGLDGSNQIFHPEAQVVDAGDLGAAKPARKAPRLDADDAYAVLLQSFGKPGEGGPDDVDSDGDGDALGAAGEVGGDQAAAEVERLLTEPPLLDPFLVRYVSSNPSKAECDAYCSSLGARGVASKQAVSAVQALGQLSGCGSVTLRSAAPQVTKSPALAVLRDATVSSLVPPVVPAADRSRSPHVAVDLCEWARVRPRLAERFCELTKARKRLATANREENEKDQSRAAAAAAGAGSEAGEGEEHRDEHSDPVRSVAVLDVAQACLAGPLFSYQDVRWTCRTWANASSLRALLVLHVANHVLKARDVLQKNEQALRRRTLAGRKRRMEKRLAKARAQADGEATAKDLTPEEPAQGEAAAEDEEDVADRAELDVADQGYTRARVLVLVPFKHAAWQFVRQLVSLLKPASVGNQKRFVEEFSVEDAPPGDDSHQGSWGVDRTADWRASPPEGLMATSGLTAAATPATGRGKPADFRQTFAGNMEDDFKVGIRVTRKALQFYAPFRSSDILVASPLGLRRILDDDKGADGAEPDAGFLSSVEVLVLDQAAVIQQQNWEHVDFVMQRLNKIPAQPGDTDFRRVRPRDLDGLAAHFRQTVLVSSRPDPTFHSFARRHCSNVSGSVSVAASYRGAMAATAVSARHVFQRVTAPSLAEMDDARFEYFRDSLLPRLRGGRAEEQGVQPHTLLYVPSYLDYVRIRNLLDEQEIDFAGITEYSERADVDRHRALFKQGRVPMLVVSGRAQFYNRHRFRGYRHLVFYAPPDEAVHYQELVNGLAAPAAAGHVVSVLTLFSKLDRLALERIVGSKHTDRLIPSGRKAKSKSKAKAKLVKDTVVFTIGS